MKTQDRDKAKVTPEQALAQSAAGMDPVRRLTMAAQEAGQGTPPDDDPQVLDELDFSKLAGDLYFDRTITLYIGGQPAPLKLTNRGVAEAARKFEQDTPQPKVPVRTVAVRRKDDEGAQLIAKGYKGPWPALREVELHYDSEEMRGYRQAMEQYQKMQVYAALGVAIVTPVRDEQGRLVEDPVAKCEVLERHGLQPSEAQQMIQGVMKWAPFSQDDLAVPTGGGGSE